MREFRDLGRVLSERGQLVACVGLELSKERKCNCISRFAAHDRIDDLIEVFLVPEEKKKEHEVGIKLTVNRCAALLLAELLLYIYKPMA